MKLLIQRVSRANVKINETIAGRIGQGLVIFVGITHEDNLDDVLTLAQKTVNLRIFPDDQDRMNLSILNQEGDVLIISQFTLYADMRKGNRPSFVQAASPEHAEPLYNAYVDTLKRLLGPEHVQTGRFRASMQVELINDGPVTIEITSE